MSTFKKTVLQTISRHQMLARGDRVLCCVSGGADSTAMLHLLSCLQGELDITVHAIHVNHGLRGDESDRDEEHVRKLCDKLGVSLEVRHLNLETPSEERARELRYREFFSVAKQLSCDKIATAHTEEDNAETVLLHLVRGSGLRGLTGIPAVRGEIIRPLLCSSRESLLIYLQDNEISYCKDSSNDCIDFSRNRIRHHVLSEFSAINPSATKSIAKTASLLKQDEDYILRDVEKYLFYAIEKNHAWQYPCELLQELHPSISSRVIMQLSRNATRNTTYSLESARIEDVLALARCKSPSAKLCLPSNLLVRRVYDKLEFVVPEKPQIEVCELREGEQCRFGLFTVHWMRKEDVKIHKNFMLYEVDSAIISDCITVRSRKIGDTIKRVGRPNKQLKRLMIDDKIEQSLRDQLPVLADGEHLILVHSVGIDERYAPKPNQDIIRIEIGLCCDETERNTD